MNSSKRINEKGANSKQRSKFYVDDYIYIFFFLIEQLNVESVSLSCPAW